MNTEQTLKQYLAELKEDDFVYRSHGANSLDRVRVSRVTRTQIVLITGGRYNRETGRSVGTTAGWERSNLRLPTPATVAEWQRKYLDNWGASSLPKAFRALSPAQQCLLYRQIKDMQSASEGRGFIQPAEGKEDAVIGAAGEASKARIEICLSACEGYTDGQLLALAGGNVKREVTHFADKMCDAQGRYMRAEQHRDNLVSALKALLEHEGTEDETSIGMFPSEALEQARKQALAAIKEAENSVDY